MRTMWRGTVAAVAGLGLFAISGVAQSPKLEEGEQPVKQMRLTEKQLQGFISAQKELAPLSSKLEALGDKQPDPALRAQLEQIARRNGFVTFGEFGDVGANISMVLDGLDPLTGQFTEIPERIKKDMEEVKQDKQASQKDKDQALSEMREALKTAPLLQFKENVALVKKYQRELEQVLGQEPAAQHEPKKK